MSSATTRVHRKLRPSDLPEIRRHLLALSIDDRYLRFHCRMGDDEVIRYCYGINWFIGVLIGCFAGSRLRGMVEIGFDRPVLPRFGETSLSVEGGWQQHGIGLNLLQRARTVAANRGLGRLVLYYLRENTRIIRSFGGTLDYVEKSGVVPVGPVSALTLYSETADELAALAQACFGTPHFPWPPGLEPSHTAPHRWPQATVAGA